MTYNVFDGTFNLCSVQCRITKTPHSGDRSCRVFSALTLMIAHVMLWTGCIINDTRTLSNKSPIHSVARKICLVSNSFSYIHQTEYSAIKIHTCHNVITDQK